MITVSPVHAILRFYLKIRPSDADVIYDWWSLTSLAVSIWRKREQSRATRQKRSSEKECRANKSESLGGRKEQPETR